MNYRQARQVDPTADRPDAGKWRYTNMNDGKVWADGACRDDCPGHATPEEAYEHQRQHLIAALVLSRLSDDEARYEPGKCAICPAVAAFVASCGVHDMPLRVCETHATVACVAPLVHVGVSVSSW